MGTPEFAVESLRRLVEGGYNVVAVVTQPDKPIGRHQDTLQPSAVKQYAQSCGLPVLQPVKMKDPAFVEELRGYDADLQVVVAFRMLPEVVWAMPRFGTFNVHAALLPQYRGAAPINWAVINGETMTGVTTFFLDHDIDTGRVILKKEFPIPDDADVEYVYDGLMRLGAEAAVETVDRLIAGGGHVASVPQEASSEELKPAPKIFKDTCHIGWGGTAKKVYDFVRGLSPYPGAWCDMVADGADDGAAGHTLKVFKTRKTERRATGEPGTMQVERNHLYVNAADFQLELLDIQLSGKKRMSASAFLNGFRDVESFVLR